MAKHITAGDYCPSQDEVYRAEMGDEMTAEEMEALQDKLANFEERHGLENDPWWNFNPYWDAIWAAEIW